MLIKEKDKNQEQVDYLTDLLERDISADKKQIVERELKCLDVADKAANYYLDAEFKESDSWILIHDLRIEHKNEMIQIDHLLIGRMMDVYVIESKNFSSGLAISDDGEFSYFYHKKPFTIASPIAQNERNITLLNDFLTDKAIFPKRLGVSLTPNYRNIVLLSSAAELMKPKKGLYDCSAVMAVDKFLGYFKKENELADLNSLIGLTKVVSSDSLRNFGEVLACHHQPLTADYSAKLCLDGKDAVSGFKTDQQLDAPECPQCGVAMVKRIVKKGSNIGKEFWGCSTYPKCKGVLDIKYAEPVEEKPADILESNVPDCPKCNKPMIERVSKKGDTKGNVFWGCVDFPKCKGTLQVEAVEAEKQESITKIDTPLCPKCNEPMVKRSAKKGKTSGNEFWGCSAFPKCRGVTSID